MPFARLLLLLFLVGVSCQVSAAEIVPHRTVNALSPNSIGGTNSISGASGSMVFDWTDVCDGWTTNLDLRVRLFTPEGEELRFGTALTSWEAKDGRVLRFLVKDRSTYFPSTDMRGRAVLDLSGAGKAHYDEPEEMTMELPKGTLFPTAHLLAVLAAAEAGERVMIAPIFDGSEEGPDALMEASAAMLGPFEDRIPRIMSLAKVPYYKINLAFFRAKEPEALPAHEITLRLYVNGVVDRQIFDYGDFILAADITDLSFHPDPGC